jgi:uncharacterized OsmC-like protein
VSPVEHLLIAVAGCYALSVRAVLTRRKLPRTTFEVVATGDKADGPVSRLARMSVTVIFQAGIPDEEASAISAEAKSICTVTNTLVTPPVIGYGVRSLREDPYAAPDTAGRPAAVAAATSMSRPDRTS